MECSDIIQKAVEHLKESFRCIPGNERICIVTPYLYPDNDLIELFVEDIGVDKVRVTDLGETLRHLESIGLDLLSSRKRRFLLNQIAQRIHITVNNGRLEKEGTVQDVGSLISDLAESARSISDLIYTSKAYEPATFPQEVSVYLNEHKIEHERNYKLTGSRTEGVYKVDIYIDGKRSSPILVDTLSPPQESAIKTTVNRTLRKWFDINGHRTKISLLNDIDYTWRDDDLKLLSDLSVVYIWSQKDRFLDYVISD